MGQKFVKELKQKIPVTVGLIADPGEGLGLAFSMEF
jgi:hypothetical protein